MKSAAIQQDLLVAAVDALPDNGMRQIRGDALARFASTGLPLSSNEDWRYTSLQPIVELSNAWLGDLSNAKYSGPGTKVADIPRQDFEAAVDARWLRFLNGRLTGDVPSAPGSEPILIDTVANGGALNIDDGITSFNAALLHDAIRISVPAGTALARPIGLLLANDATGPHRVSTARIILDVGSRSVVNVLEHHVSLSADPAYANVVIELRIGKGARVNFLRLQQCSDAQMLTGKLIASVSDDAAIHYSSLDLGGALVRNDVIIDLDARGGDIRANGLYLSSGLQHIDNHVRVEHRKGPARSRAMFRGILNDRSRCVFNSKAIVHKGADGTDAEQYNHNLLLSDRAEIDTKPELEIYADEVKCAHGATVGQLDKTALFYLRSRGIDEAAATRMLTRAFAATILGDLSVPGAADFIARRVESRLDTLVGQLT